MLNISIDVIGRREPVKRTHGKVIVFSAVNSELLFKVVKRIKSVSGIKIFVIFSVAALDLAVVPRRVWLDQLVTYPTLFEVRLEQCGDWIIALAESLREFTAVIRLHTLYLKWEFLNEMFQKYC